MTLNRLWRRKNINSTPLTPTKHVPRRTCIACREAKAKRELLRVVYTPACNIEIDASGKKAGRGAYLCRNWKCWEVGLAGNRLEHALRSHIAAEDREGLLKQVRDLLQGETGGKGK